MGPYRFAGGFVLLLAATTWSVSQTLPSPTPQDLTSLSLENLLKIQVRGASLHPQTLQDAPASVTILTADEIYRYGYRTLAEALASVRGFYTTNDRTYQTVGVRGFGLPGDYASRILVLVNGHNMADNVFDSNLWFGPDFPIDMSLIQQIEIIRGPSSALYGTSGVLATVNIITKSPQQADPPQVILDTGSFGEKKAQISASVPIGKNASLLLSGSVFNNAGESPLMFPQLDAPATNMGRAIGVDGQRGYHFFSNLVWRNWSLTAVLSQRDQIQPLSWGQTVFNDPGTQVIEPSDYVEAEYTRERTNRTLRWRTYYSATHLQGRFDFPLASGVEDYRTCSCGDWIGTELTYRFYAARFGAITTGAEAKVDLRVLQSSGDVSPVPINFVNIDRRDRSVALFAQEELDLSPHWKLDLGIRLDASAYRHSFVSPRAALIYQPSSAWTYKLLYGRAFRNPSAFHLFYQDGVTAIANPGLRPENADTIEVNVERKFGKRLSILAAAYGYWLRDFLAGVYTADGLLQYQNLGGVFARGLEVELNGRPAAWLELGASYALQRATDTLTSSWLPNSAEHQAKLHAGVPIGRKLDATSSMQYYSSRKTLAGLSLKPVYLADFTLASHQLFHNFDLRLGIRNTFNSRYSDPIALDSRVDSMPQPGRTFFVELIAHADR